MIVSVSVVYMIGSNLIKRVNYDKLSPDKGVTPVQLKTEAGLISGAFYKGEDHKPVIALFHPLGGSQESMKSRARLLQGVGYNVMTIDLNAHGQSSGEYNTFGYIESKDVRETFRYLKKRFPKSKIGAIGVSLGAASILLSGVKFDAVVIEESYADISTAIKNRISMALGDWAKPLSWMLTSQLPLRLGIEADMLSPENAIKKINYPVFIIGGEEDRRATLSETMRLFHAVPSYLPKELWVVKKAHHQNFYAFAEQKYKNKVLTFFEKYLQ